VTLGLFHARAGRMGGMSEERKKKGGAGAIVLTIVALLLVLLVLYVLSSGPASRLLDGVEGGEKIWNTIYYPLYAWEPPWLVKMLSKYVTWWQAPSEFHP
jgi:hypothetical protein